MRKFVDQYKENKRMAEELHLTGNNKNEKYASLLPQLQALTAGTSDQIANMANLSAALKESFDFLWVGFYRVIKDTLLLGPFQGPIACLNIAKGQGVCGTAWLKEKTIIVPDVADFPGHIACSSASRSEIVVPLFCEGKVFAVLDIDSTSTKTFDAIDAYYLELIVNLV